MVPKSGSILGSCFLEAKEKSHEFQNLDSRSDVPSSCGIESFSHALIIWQIINIFKCGMVVDVCQFSVSCMTHITAHNLIDLFWGGFLPQVVSKLL